MNAPLRQSDRLGCLTTELGPDVVVLLRFDGTDHLNDLFEYRVEALANRNDLDFDALIGAHATVGIEGHEGPQSFDGIVTQARWAGVGENGHRYDLALRPWFDHRVVVTVPAPAHRDMAIGGITSGLSRSMSRSRTTRSTSMAAKTRC